MDKLLSEVFIGDKKIHGIVNFNSSTPAKISVMKDMVDVTAFEYAKVEEHDADKLFSGMLLKQYFVNQILETLKKCNKNHSLHSKNLCYNEDRNWSSRPQSG